MGRMTGLVTGLAFLLTINSFSQDKFISKKGHIWFFSHTPVENIEAHNNESAMVLDVKTGDISVQLLMKSFKFQRALMEEHFNENYIESSKFPKGEFKGKIKNITEIDFSKNGSYKVTVEGNLTMHGVSKNISEKGTIEVKDGKLMVKAKFTVIPRDFAISIPDLVKDKIAKSMEVNVDVTLELYKK